MIRAPTLPWVRPSRRSSGSASARELGDLAQADLVRLVRGQAGRGVVAQAERVEALAVGQPAGGRAGAGAAAQLGQKRDLAVERGGEAAVDDRRRLRAPIAGDALLARAADQRADQPGSLAALGRAACGSGSAPCRG